MDLEWVIFGGGWMHIAMVVTFVGTGVAAVTLLPYLLFLSRDK